MQINLNSPTGGPIYAQVRDQISELITSKQIVNGEPLPSPSILAQKLSVDRGEIQRAYYELERSGVLEKRKGKDRRFAHD